ncbi:plasmid replication/partition related protein [Variovorax ureilyticus]|uniref:plasmid replication/partition related protein n=1 Tax=Variovorax ureilyticus TaxID=1836198 RepID=UPI003D67F663
MDVVVNEELKAYIDPLTAEEFEALERSLLAEGCRDALVLWGDVLVDGHNRYAICRKHGLPFQTVQNTRFKSIEDVHLWMIDQHLGRRSISDFQRGVLALRKREIVAARRARRDETPAEPSGEAVHATPVETSAAEDALQTREAVARAARLRSNQVVMIEKIQRSAAPEVVAAVKSGTLSLNAAAAVASLPAEEQVAAAVAGKDELKQAAKRVREARRKPAREMDAAAQSDAPETGGDDDGAAVLRRQVSELRAENAKLTAENAALRKQVLALLAKGAPAASAAQPDPVNGETDADAPF